MKRYACTVVAIFTVLCFFDVAAQSELSDGTGGAQTTALTSTPVLNPNTSEKIAECFVPSVYDFPKLGDNAGETMANAERFWKEQNRKHDTNFSNDCLSFSFNDETDETTWPSITKDGEVQHLWFGFYEDEISEEDVFKIVNRALPDSATLSTYREFERERGITEDTVWLANGTYTSTTNGETYAFYVEITEDDFGGSRFTVSIDVRENPPYIYEELGIEPQ